VETCRVFIIDREKVRLCVEKSSRFLRAALLLSAFQPIAACHVGDDVVERLPWKRKVLVLSWLYCGFHNSDCGNHVRLVSQSILT
jgi:hypothetical protein